MSRGNCSNWGREKGVRGESWSKRCESKSMRYPRPPPCSELSVAASLLSLYSWGERQILASLSCRVLYRVTWRGTGCGCSFLPLDGWLPLGTGHRRLPAISGHSQPSRTGPRPLCLEGRVTCVHPPAGRAPWRAPLQELGAPFPAFPSPSVACFPVAAPHTGCSHVGGI